MAAVTKMSDGPGNRAATPVFARRRVPSTEAECDISVGAERWDLQDGGASQVGARSFASDREEPRIGTLPQIEEPL